MTILTVAVGLALVFFGRRLFWLFVGGIGFTIGLALAMRLTQRQEEWLILAIGVMAGLIGALFTIFLERFAIGAAGFLAGGYALMKLAESLGYPAWAGIAFVAGAVLGALLVMALFDWALILLSALTGALLITEHLGVEPGVALLFFAVLLVAGVAVQGGRLQRRVLAEAAPVERR